MDNPRENDAAITIPVLEDHLPGKGHDHTSVTPKIIVNIWARLQGQGHHSH
jgi:hypothetical protein